MATMRLSDRLRRAEQLSTLGGLVRALADQSTPLEALAGPDVLEATQRASERTGLSGPHQSVAGLPLGALLRDLTATGGSSSGGALVGSARMDAQESLRPFSVVVDAGARVVEVPAGSGTPGMPKITTPPVAGWVSAEGGDVPTSDAVFGIGEPVPRRLGLTFNVSWRLARQGGELFDALIRAEITAALGRGIDAAVLAGTGADGQPQGLATLSGVNTTAGASLDHADLLAMRKGCVVGGAREDRLRWVGTATVQEVLAARERASGGGRFLWDDGQVLGLPAHATDAAAASTLIAGDFGQVTVYLFSGLDLVVDRRSVVSSGRIKVTASLYADVIVARPAVFSVASSVS